MSQEDAALVEVVVLGHNDKTVLTRIIPNLIVVGPLHLNTFDMGGSRIQIGDPCWDLIREVLVEQKLHAAAMKSLRSRSAANARQAWMSSAVSSSKSRRISSTDMPLAK